MQIYGTIFICIIIVRILYKKNSFVSKLKENSSYEKFNYSMKTKGIGNINIYVI